jgi:hypothetical protein
LDRFRIRGTQNLQEIIVRDEVESWEAHLLGFKIVSQTLLALIKIEGDAL